MIENDAQELFWDSILDSSQTFSFQSVFIMLNLIITHKIMLTLHKHVIVH